MRSESVFEKGHEKHSSSDNREHYETTAKKIESKREVLSQAGIDVDRLLLVARLSVQSDFQEECEKSLREYNPSETYKNSEEYQKSEYTYEGVPHVLEQFMGLLDSPEYGDDEKLISTATALLKEFDIVRPLVEEDKN